MIRTISAGIVLAALASTGPAAAETAARVVSVGGFVTETVYAVGAQSKLIADDQSSVYPASARTLPQVGYMRTLAAEGILSLHPDLVLAAPEAGPKPILDQISGAGVRLVRLADGYTPEAALGRMSEIGRQLGRETEAGQLTHDLATDLAIVRAEIEAAKDRPRVLFLLQVGHGAPMVSGKGTAADAMIALAGGVNAAADAFAGYKPLSPEAAGSLAPDVILMTNESVEAMGGRDAILALPELKPTPAARNGRLVSLEALYLLGFGPRLAHALHDLAVGLHPNDAFPPLPQRPWTTLQ